jgi:hypothetical protein
MDGSQLADFLRTGREALQPEDVGLGVQRHPGRHRETVTERNRRSQLRSQAGHDLLGGRAAVTELAALRFAVAAVSCGSRHRLTGRLAVASPSL